MGNQRHARILREITENKEWFPFGSYVSSGGRSDVVRGQNQRRARRTWGRKEVGGSFCCSGPTDVLSLFPALIAHAIVMQV